MTEMLRVVATRNGYRRAGRAWSTAKTEVPADNFTDEELAALESDPNLAVARFPAAPPEASRPSGSGKRSTPAQTAATNPPPDTPDELAALESDPNQAAVSAPVAPPEAPRPSGSGKRSTAAQAAATSPPSEAPDAKASGL